MAIIDPSRLTTWSPGVIGGIPVRNTVFTTINAATYGNGSLDSSAAVQTALDACTSGQVVLLSAGAFRWDTTIIMNRSNIVLRGAGQGRTKVRGPASDKVILMGPSGPPSNVIYSTLTDHTLLTVDAVKGDTTITVADATGYASGDLALISMRDDATVWPPPNTGGDFLLWIEPGPFRHSRGQVVHIASVAGNDITIDENILHMGFEVANAAVLGKVPTVVSGTGIEDIVFKNANDSTIIGSFCEQCWIKGVETDTSKGSTQWWVSNRCEIRESYVHHAQTYTQGGAGYGISLDAYTSNSLVENNAIFFFNKPVLFRASGGGNVVGYNYVMGAQLGSVPSWMEPDIDGHMVFPHFELVEGNYCGMIGLQNTWGGSGYMTYYRNRVLAQHPQPQLINVQNVNQAAFGLNAGAGNCNMAGNVLGLPGLKTTSGIFEGSPAIYDNTTEADGYNATQVPAMYRLGNGSEPGAYASFDQSETPYPSVPLVAPTARITGNFDYVTNTVVWADADHTLPDSYYLSGKPDFFEADDVWPWVDPVGSTKEYVLPAKRRFDAINANGFFGGF